ncbi:MAG: YCF48-related protein [Pseudomonadales bacterium]
MNKKSASYSVLVSKLRHASSIALLMATAVTAYAQDAAVSSQKPAIKSEKVAQSLLQDIVRVGDRLVVVGERGHIATSDDNGKTWQQAEVPTRAMMNAVFFISASEGWAVGHDGLVLHTTDGGKTWAIQLDGLKFTRKLKAESIPGLEAKLKELEVNKKAAEDQLEGMDSAETAAGSAADDVSGADDAGSEVESDTTVSEVDVADSAREQVEAMVLELDDKIADTESKLSDAKAALVNTVANPLMDVWFRDAQTGFAVGAFGEMIATQDGGVTWSNVAERLNNPDRYHLNAIVGEGDLMYIAGEAGHVFRSTNGGASWVQLDSPDPENGSFFAINIISSNEVFIAGLRGVMYRSVDRGDSWKQIAETLHKNINAAYFVDKDTVLAVGNDGAFFRSRDGGRTFQGDVRKNRLTIASAAAAANGDYILVGAGGVEIVPPASL